MDDDDFPADLAERLVAIRTRTEAKWPTGCVKPNVCKRFRACGVIGCRHEHRDISSEIDAELTSV